MKDGAAKKRSVTRGSTRRVIRVALVDDHPVVREGLRSVLDVPDIEVVGEAESGEAAAALVRSLEPHVLVLDIKMPGKGGLEAIKAVKAIRPRTAVLVFTIYNDAETLRKAVLCGAAGYLCKDATGLELLNMIRRIAAGEDVLDRAVLREVIKSQHPPKGAPGDAFERATRDLTPQEIELLRRVLQGHTNQEIQKSTRLSRNTVKTHLKSLFRKLGVSDRTQVILWAIRVGCAPHFFAPANIDVS